MTQTGLGKRKTAGPGVRQIRLVMTPSHDDLGVWFLEFGVSPTFVSLAPLVSVRLPSPATLKGFRITLVATLEKPHDRPVNIGSRRGGNPGNP